MQSLPASDPLVWLIASYLLGTLACIAWTLLVQALRPARHGQRGPAG